MKKSELMSWAKKDKQSYNGKVLGVGKVGNQEYMPPLLVQVVKTPLYDANLKVSESKVSASWPVKALPGQDVGEFVMWIDGPTYNDNGERQLPGGKEWAVFNQSDVFGGN